MAEMNSQSVATNFPVDEKNVLLSTVRSLLEARGFKVHHADASRLWPNVALPADLPAEMESPISRRNLRDENLRLRVELATDRLVQARAGLRLLTEECPSDTLNSEECVGLSHARREVTVANDDLISALAKLEAFRS